MAPKCHSYEGNRILSIEALMNELRQEYIQALPAKLQKIEEIGSQGDIEALENEFHKMKGTGRTYGLPEVSLVAAAAEARLKAQGSAPQSWLPEVLSLLKAIHVTRTHGSEYDLNSSPEYQRLTNS